MIRIDAIGHRFDGWNVPPKLFVLTAWHLPERVRLGLWICSSAEVPQTKAEIMIQHGDVEIQTWAYRRSHKLRKTVRRETGKKRGTTGPIGVSR